MEVESGRVTTAAGDEKLKDIFNGIRTSKTPRIICRLSSIMVLLDIDECPEATQHIRYTPTFHFYRDGERVDEMFGAGEERLQDRLWLHS